MGIILCPIHGRSNISFVSPLIAEMVLHDQKPDDAIVEVTLEIEPDIVSTHPVDAEFVRLIRERFARDEEIIRLSSEEDVFEVFGMLAAICANCLAAWLKGNI